MRCKFFFSLSSLSFSVLQALPLGNPSSPLIPEEGFFISKDAFLSVGTSYIGDWIFDRDLEFKNDKPLLRDSFPSFYSESQCGRLSLNFVDRAELHLQLGSASVQFSQRPQKETMIDYSTDHVLCYGVFGNVLLAYWGDVDMSVSAGYLAFNSAMKNIEVNGQSQDPGPASMHYREWSAGIGFSYKMAVFTPYAGIDYSSLVMKLKHLSSLSALAPYHAFSIKNKYTVGLVLGCDLSAYKGFSLNLETRLIDEIALTVNAKLRF